jgi:hypothetical protein
LRTEVRHVLPLGLAGSDPRSRSGG